MHLKSSNYGKKIELSRKVTGVNREKMSVDGLEVKKRLRRESREMANEALAIEGELAGR